MVRPLKRMSSHSSYILTGLEKRMGGKRGIGLGINVHPTAGATR